MTYSCPVCGSFEGERHTCHPIVKKPLTIIGTETGRFTTVGTVFYAPCCHVQLNAEQQLFGTCPACKELVVPVECCAECLEPLHLGCTHQRTARK